MINVDIITAEMRVINGANRVTEKLIYGKDIFKEHGINLRKLYTDSYEVNCSDYVSTLGNHSANYSKKRKVIDFLKKLFIYKTRLAQSYIQNKIIERSKASVDRYDAKDVDCIIFQDVFCAYFYLIRNDKEAKTILITHTDEDPLEQYLLGRPQLKGSKMEKKIRDIYKYTFENVDKLITICDQARNYVASNYDANVACVMNGIEPLKNPNITKRNYEYPLQVVILGSLTFRKGHDLLIDGYNALSKEEQDKLRINIVGNGERREELEKYVASKGLIEKVVFHGEIKDVEDILSKMDVMILPSRADTVPIAIIEGLRSGLFVISTKKGEIPNMLSNCGKIIDASIDGVKEALKYILDNKDKLESYSSLSIKKYKDNYSIDKMITNYSNEINSLFVEGK